ncbi:MAG: TlpA disulfide reductase family protein [Brevundimonas sp.]|nr:TlpA disulfide reductase family protein [Brevundimonas sp.]
MALGSDIKGSVKTALAIGAAVLVALVAGGVLLYPHIAPGSKDGAAAGTAGAPQSELSAYAKGPLTRLSAPVDLVSAPDYGFVDREGEAASFADFRGKVVVVNLWAMWCAPCRTEMPTLATLASAYEGTDLLVLPINVDSGDDAIADAKSFLDVHEPLPFYSDKSFRLPFLFPESGKMPQTILLDRQGRIRATFAGEADWASAEARALVDALLAES